MKSLLNFLPWIKDESNPADRQWEEFYRNRWQHDKVVRSTHGVNCTGGCSWNIYVKNGIVTWELQALDYPLLEPSLPPYEPRGCQRGISYSWYLYSPIRVRYPYIRGRILDLWAAARREHSDPVAAWQAIVSDPHKRASWQNARGKGGFRRASWETAVEIIAAAEIATIKKYGPDRIAGFSPIPAMSMLSYASGARMLQLQGGVCLSFYDWYCDLPTASPEVWGEQTDVHESADWYNAKMTAIMGANLNMTRTPDCHFMAESRHNGTKVYVFSPDFSQVSKYADEWIAINAGQDGAWWMAVNHVLLTEFHHQRQVPYFVDYTKKYTDAPHLVELETTANGKIRPGQLLRANRLKAYHTEENGEWKFLFWDTTENKPKMPMGSAGHRWATKKKGQWNLLLQDGKDGSVIDPELSFLKVNDGVASVTLDNFAAGSELQRGVPYRKLTTHDGKEVLVATIYDILMAQYGVNRGLPGEYAPDYDDETSPYTPAWSEKYTGIGRKSLIRFAREWGNTAEATNGKCLIIIGAGINHWYHGNLMYRAGIHALMFTGSVGVNGGGLAHYVGQEKLAPGESWSAVAFAKDWYPPSRLQNAPSWHYVNTDQWRYERSFLDYHTVPQDQPAGSLATGHTMDAQVRSVRNGWMPFYPQFNQSNLELAVEAEKAGAKTEADTVRYVVDKLKSRKLKFSVEDPDAPENWPRVWFIWRGNALMASSKGHEFFLDHYLGTHSNKVAREVAQGHVKEVTWHDKAPHGKMDLVVDLNFRMDTSALYSDIVLPAATWYEKHDLNSTDLHSFIHPLSEAVPPSWESKSDWEIFKLISLKFSEMAVGHFPKPVKDIVALPLAHDSAAEIAQPAMKEWIKGEVEAIPGVTMPGLKVVERDFTKVYQQFISFGPAARNNGLGAHGTKYAIDDLYDEMIASRRHPLVEWDGKKYPSLKYGVDACNIVLHFASVTNGELAYRSYKNMEEKVGLPLVQLAEEFRGVHINYKDLQAQPRRLNNSPMWSGLVTGGRAYSPFTYNVEHLVPWRTLTGRQHFYLDHPGYLQFGEHVPTYKPKPSPSQYADIVYTPDVDKSLMLNYLTPHGKWHIHSTYGDTERMLTLSRGTEPLWMNDEDAASIGIHDNDYVEVFNDNGVVVTRAAVSARIPRGICIQYHSPERTYAVPKSPLRNNRRAGGHNSLTRTRLKPNFLVGGYGQFTYHFNYWGPLGCNRDTHIMVRKLPNLQW